MEKIGGSQASPSISRKEKKKAKDEMDRIKQAEKKKRRLEKALATSAAIRSELEKKKERKREEQQRLDEEGAAIAESVALHVLGGEDKDDAWSQTKIYDYMEDSRSISFFFDYQGFKKPAFEGVGWVCDTYGSGFNWGSFEISRAVPSGIWRTHIHTPHLEETGQRTKMSPGLVAAEAFSALQIAESSYAMNRRDSGTMGSDLFTEEAKFYEEY